MLDQRIRRVNLSKDYVLAKDRHHVLSKCNETTYLFSQHRDTELDSIFFPLYASSSRPFTMQLFRSRLSLEHTYSRSILNGISMTSLKFEIYMHIIISNASARRIRDSFIIRVYNVNGRSIQFNQSDFFILYTIHKSRIRALYALS